MDIDARVLVPMAGEAQGLSKLARIVDEHGMAVITRNDKPSYMVVSFSEYNELQAGRREMFIDTACSVIEENIVALKELAK